MQMRGRRMCVSIGGRGRCVVSFCSQAWSVNARKRVRLQTVRPLFNLPRLRFVRLRTSFGDICCSSALLLVRWRTICRLTMSDVRDAVGTRSGGS